MKRVQTDVNRYTDKTARGEIEAKFSSWTTKQKPEEIVKKTVEIVKETVEIQRKQKNKKQ